jgi:hypothetical protein
MSQFHYSNFKPDEALQFEAERALDEILELAPEGAIAVALLSQEDGQYRCSMDIYSSAGPFIVNIVQPNPYSAVHHMAVTLKAKLALWRRKRMEYQKAAKAPGKRFDLAIA